MLNIPIRICRHIWRDLQKGKVVFAFPSVKIQKYRFGWEIRPSFSVSQNKDRAVILKYFQDHLDCGYIRENKSDKTLKYEVRALSDLCTKVIPFFDEFRLFTAKKNDFYKFRSVCGSMKCKDHLTREGFNSIMDTISLMNPSGKRKYNPQQIKI